jgi:hypothetical protein
MRRILAIAPVLMAFSAMVGALRTDATAAEQWVHASETGIFQVRSEFSLRDSDSQQLLEEIEQLQSDVATRLDIEVADRPVQLSIFSGRWSYSRYVSLRVPEGANRPALYVQGPDMGHVFVYRRWGFETDVRHECTHAVLHNALPYIPLWLDEGLAEYFEVPRDERASDHPHLGSLRRAMFFGWRPDLERLEELSSLTEMGSREYQESWAWAHFMLHGPEDVRDVLLQYLAKIQKGEFAGPLSEQLHAVNGRTPEQRMLDHLDNWE